MTIEPHELVSFVSSYFPFFTGLFSLKYHNNPLRLLWGLSFVWITVEIIAIFLMMHEKTIFILYNILVIIEMVFFTLILYCFQTSLKWKKRMIRSLPIVVLFLLIKYLAFANIMSYNLSNKFIVYLIIAIVSYLTLVQMKNEWINWKFEPRFWIIIGTFFYFACASFIFLVGNLTYFVFPKAWLLHTIVNVITNVAFAWAFICAYLKGRKTVI